MWSSGSIFIGDLRGRVAIIRGVHWQNGFITRHSFARLTLRWLGLAVLALAFALPAAAQDWFKTGTGLGVTKARLALADTVARSTFCAAAAENLSRCCLGRSGLFRDSGYGQPELLSAAGAGPAERVKGARLGGRSCECVHGRLRQSGDGRIGRCVLGISF